MDKRVLFTCVGKTDPIRDCRDGAMLHIVRNYRPQKVYIVLSKEMRILHEKDNRYNKAIQKFNRDFYCNIEVEFFPCEIEDVSNFDAFDELFQKYLGQVSKENPGAEILLNVSSGSPQMKITMCLLSDNVKFKDLKVIQVTTPQNGANISENTAQGNYDVDAQIELNEDNEPGAENRCREPAIFTMKKALALKQVQALLESYEYKSAKILLDTYGLSKIYPDALALTKHLLLRQDLKTRDAENVTDGKNFGINLFPVANVKCKEETEFFLVLKNLSKTGKITEFTLRLNPFVIRMQELYLLKKCSFNCEKIKETDYRGVENIKREKIIALDPELCKKVDGYFKPCFKDSPPSIVFYNRILAILNNGKMEVKHYIEFFETCEKINRERNTSAHTLYGMNESDLKKMGVTSKEILDTFRKLLCSCYGKECKQEIFKIYDRVNKLIMENL